MRIWGLIPHWSKDKNIGPRLINARAETLAEKPSFKSSFRQRRCLIPADGFFEWKRDDGVKQPFRITTEDQAIFSFAGLWDSWREGISGATIETFTIITTPANSLVSEIHDRMPAILKKEDEARWLDPAITAPKALLPLLYPYPSEKMRMFPVSSVVNSWKNDTPECIEPVR